MNDHFPQREKPTIRYPYFVIALAALCFLAACSPAEAVKGYTKGEELAYYDFSQPGTFEEGAYQNGQARFEIRDGSYHIDLSEGDSVLWYGQWGNALGDVVIDVEMKQTTESQNTTYGVICRARGAVGQFDTKPDADLTSLAGESNGSLLASAAQSLAGLAAEATAEATGEPTVEATGEATAEATSEATAEVTAEATSEATAEVTREPAFAGDANSASSLVNNGDGYLFLIQGSGNFAIMRSRGGNVTPLVDWKASGSIKTGPAQNRMRAVCLGTYLALYINGDFMADASDDTYTQGQIGLVAEAHGRLGTQVQFDNLSVSEAKET